MFMCAVSLSHPNSREWYLLYVKCLCLLSRYLRSREWHLLYVKCLCLLSRYLSPVVVGHMNGVLSRYLLEMLLMFVCVVSLSQPSSSGICYMLNVCVCCLVISVPVVICIC